MTPDEQAFNVMQKRIHAGIYAMKKNLMVDPSATDTVIVCSPQTWHFLKTMVHKQQFPFYAQLTQAVPTPGSAGMTYDILTIGGVKVVPDEKLSASALLFRTESVIP